MTDDVARMPGVLFCGGEIVDELGVHVEDGVGGDEALAEAQAEEGVDVVEGGGEDHGDGAEGGGAARQEVEGAYEAGSVGEGACGPEDFEGGGLEDGDAGEAWADGGEAPAGVLVGEAEEAADEGGCEARVDIDAEARGLEVDFGVIDELELVDVADVGEVEAVAEDEMGMAIEALGGESQDVAGVVGVGFGEFVGGG
jgi:hypothetical protein